MHSYVVLILQPAVLSFHRLQLSHLLYGLLIPRFYETLFVLEPLDFVGQGLHLALALSELLVLVFEGGLE